MRSDVLCFSQSGRSSSPTQTQRSFGSDNTTPRAYFRASWAFVLGQLAPNTTRLLVRWRMRFAPRLLGHLLTWGLLGPGDSFMQAKMLHTIKQLVERAATPAGTARIYREELRQLLPPC